MNVLRPLMYLLASSSAAFAASVDKKELNPFSEENPQPQDGLVSGASGTIAEKLVVERPSPPGVTGSLDGYSLQFPDVGQDGLLPVVQLDPSGQAGSSQLRCVHNPNIGSSEEKQICRRKANVNQRYGINPEGNTGTVSAIAEEEKYYVKRLEKDFHKVCVASVVAGLGLLLERVKTPPAQLWMVENERDEQIYLASKKIEGYQSFADILKARGYLVEIYKEDGSLFLGMTERFNEHTLTEIIKEKTSGSITNYAHLLIIALCNTDSLNLYDIGFDKDGNIVNIDVDDPRVLNEEEFQSRIISNIQFYQNTFGILFPPPVIKEAISILETPRPFSGDGIDESIIQLVEHHSYSIAIIIKSMLEESSREEALSRNRGIEVAADGETMVAYRRAQEEDVSQGIRI